MTPLVVAAGKTILAAGGLAAGGPLTAALGIITVLCTIFTGYLSWKVIKANQHKDEGQVGVGFAQEAFETLRAEVAALRQERKEWVLERRKWVDERERWHEERARLMLQIEKLNGQLGEVKKILMNHGIKV